MKQKDWTSDYQEDLQLLELPSNEIKHKPAVLAGFELCEDEDCLFLFRSKSKNQIGKVLQ